MPRPVQNPADRRQQLTAWLAGSRAVQRRLLVLAAIGLLATVALAVAGLGTIALIVGATAVFIAGMGSWITQGHIADFRTQLDNLERQERDRAS